MAKDGALVEWASVHGELYGTPRANLEEAARENKVLVLDIDVQGAAQLEGSHTDTVNIFLLPPSAEVLLERLRGRGSEEAEELATRLRTAQTELEALDRFDYVVMNDSLDETVRMVGAIIEAESQRRSRRLTEIADFRDRLKVELDKAL